MIQWPVAPASGLHASRAGKTHRTKDDISGKKLTLSPSLSLASAIKQLQILKHFSSVLHYWLKLFSLCLVRMNCSSAPGTQDCYQGLITYWQLTWWCSCARATHAGLPSPSPQAQTTGCHDAGPMTCPPGPESLGTAAGLEAGCTPLPLHPRHPAPAPRPVPGLPRLQLAFLCSPRSTLSPSGPQAAPAPDLAFLKQPVQEDVTVLQSHRLWRQRVFSTSQA